MSINKNSLYFFKYITSNLQYNLNNQKIQFKNYTTYNGIKTYHISMNNIVKDI